MLLLVALGLGACAAPPSPRYTPPVPQLESDGLPGAFKLCVRNKAETTAAIYDAYYPCERELVFYVAELPGLSQEDKAILVEDLQKRGLNYAQDTVTSRHGADAVRRTIEPPKPLPRYVDGNSDWVDGPDGKVWTECLKNGLRERAMGDLPESVAVTAIVSDCKPLFRGEPDQDVAITTAAVRRFQQVLRDRAPKVIEQKRMPEGNIRM
jgi:hypothetical protein